MEEVKDKGIAMDGSDVIVIHHDQDVVMLIGDGSSDTISQVNSNGGIELSVVDCDIH